MSVLNIQDQLLQNFEKQTEFENNAFGETRKNAAEAFSKLGVPTVKNEDWKYSNLKGLSKKAYSFESKSDLNASDLAELPFEFLKGIKLTFVNGIFSEELSDLNIGESKLEVSNLAKLKSEGSELLNEHFGKYLDQKNEGLSALNTAFANDGMVVNIPKNTTLDRPVILNYISDARKENIGSLAHNLIVVGENSEAKFVEIFSTIGEESAFGNITTEIVVNESARVDYYKIQNENDASYHVGTTQVQQKTKSYFYSATVTLNGGFVRNNLNLVLDGQHIDNHMYGLYIPNGNQHVDNHTVVDHQLPNCQSNELYKGVLMGKSTGVFNGKIFVREDAQKTNAYQNCRNVIVSDDATMNSKPQLEIWADDVKCSHGTTTGKLNNEAIFYMQSRGIPKVEAVKLQLIAFAEDVVSQIKIEGIREKLEELIHEKLS